MKPIKKGKKQFFISLIAAALALAGCFGFSVTSYAYFNFGTVGVSLGASSVNLSSGSSETVSVSLNPTSHDQLLGCGMEMCPQECGNYPDRDCLDANGQCTCNGKTYSTYYTDVSVSSDNTSVATASYSGGALKITGVNEGKAVITVTGSLRQWTAGSATVAVSVSGSNSASSDGESSGASWSIDSSGSSNSSNASSSGNNNNVTATPVGGTDNAQGEIQDTEGEVQEQEAQEQETQEEEAEESDNEITVIDSDKGTIYMVPVTPGILQGKEQFEEIMGREDAYVDFQVKDEVGNILYAWEFCGKDITRAEDMDFGIEYSQTPFDGCSYGSSDNSLYLHFAHEGEFVGKASIFLNVAEYFSDDDVLNLYRYDPETDTIELVAEGLAVENGYVTMELTEGGYYILTTEDLLAEPEPEEEEIEEEPEVTDELVEPAAVEPEEVEEGHTGLSAGAIAAIVIVAAAVAALIIFLVIRAVRKKRQGPDDGTEEGIEEGAETELEEGFGEGVEAESEENLEESPEESAEESTGERPEESAKENPEEGFEK